MAPITHPKSDTEYIFEEKKMCLTKLIQASTMMPSVDPPDLTGINSNTVRCDQRFFEENFYFFCSQINYQRKVIVSIKGTRLFILN